MKKILSKIDFKDILIFLIPFVIFSITLLSFWPGIIPYDGANQWAQIQAGSITDSHPFFHTFTIFLLSKIWNSETILLIAQILSFSFLWTYICKWVRKIFSNKRVFLIETIFTIIMCLCPIIYMYTITMWKDILYSYSLLAASLFILIGIHKKFNYSLGEISLFSICMSLIIAYRHNGKLVIIMLLPILMLIMYKNKVTWKKIVALFLITISCFSLTLIPKSIYCKSVDGGGSMGGLYVFILSTFVHEDVEMSEKDTKLLYEILPEKDWDTYYDPYLINTISLAPNMNSELVDKEHKQLLNMIIKYSTKNPLVLAKHYLKADALLWSPYPIGYVYVYPFTKWEPPYGFEDITRPKLEMTNKLLMKPVTLTMQNKYIRVLSYQPGTILFASVILCFLIVRKLKDKRYFLVLLPMILNTVSLAPVNLAQDLRYVYINYLTFFFVLLLFVIVYFNRKCAKIKESEGK